MTSALRSNKWLLYFLVPLRASDTCLYIAVLWCVFSFKISLVGVGEAGIRIDDGLILLAVMLLILRGDFVRIPLSRSFRAYLIFVLVNIASVVWNGMAGRVSMVYAMFFAARLVEYMVFYYLGYALMESGVNVWRGLRIYFYILCAVVPLQTLRLLPVASHFNASRASGNTNGPYELAAVAAFFLCYFGYRKRNKWGAAAAFLMVLSTASRITFVGTLLSLTKRLMVQSRSKVRVVAVAVVVLLLMLGGKVWLSSMPAVTNQDEGLASRLQGSTSLTSFDEAQQLYASVPVYRTSGQYVESAYLMAIGYGAESEKDVSGLVRLFRWVALLKSSTANVDSLIIGLGPSFGSAAVDGYFVRVFVETGLIGLASFLYFLREMLRRKTVLSSAFREYVFILIVTGCFIDIFVAYKAMLLLWLWHGMEEFDRRKRGNANSLSDAG